MTPERWSQIKSHFNAALELPLRARAAHLRTVCGDDAQLLSEVSSLLEAHEAQDNVLDRAPYAQIGAAVAAHQEADGEPDATRVGLRIGAYRLTERIGRGGMGEVYKAERADDQYQAQVAVKLVREEYGAARLAWRFRSERQILAALEHRNIARLIDGGTTDDGLPFLVMELVSGQPIDRHCDDRGLDVNERVRLFLQVCAAVSFAHQRLVVHRDLKPNNILVTQDGSVKLLDFGVAKLLDADGDVRETDDATAIHVRVMTLEYASPEQVRGEPVTTVSDVYSLGVVLYRLLTGRSPYRAQGTAAARAAEIVGETTPSRPSVAVMSDDARPQEQQRLQPDSMLKRSRRALRGDLDNVLLMALRKEPQRRYASVEQFADDLRRCLDGMPVRARGDSWRYRATMFVKRHRYAAAAGFLGVSALMVGIVATTWQARIAAEQSQIARQEARKQRAVQSFLTALFDKNTRLQPNAAKARNMPVHEVLVEAGDRVLAEFADEPAVHIEVLNTVARLLLDIDEFERAGALWRESVRIARANALTGGDAYVEGLIGVATAGRLLGRGEEALAARDQALAELDVRGDASSLLRARALATTVAQFAPDPEREIALVSAAVELFRRRHPAQPAYFSAVYVLGNLQRTQGDMEGAARRFHEAVRVFDSAGSRDFTNLAASYAWAAFCQMQLGRIDDALRDYETGVALLRQHAGDASMFTRIHLGLYANALHQAGRNAQASRYFDEVLTAAALTKPTAVEFDTAVYRANALLEAGRPRDALATLRSFDDTWFEFGRRFVPNGVQWLTARARALSQLGEMKAAREELARVAELPAFYGAAPQQSDAYIAAAIEIALRAHDLQAANDALAQRPPDIGTPTFSTWRELVGGKAWLKLRQSDAQGVVRDLDAAFEYLNAHVPDNGFPFLRADLLHARGAAHASLGRLDAALTDLEAARELMHRLHDPGSAAQRDVRRLLAALQSAQ